MIIRGRTGSRWSQDLAFLSRSRPGFTVLPGFSSRKKGNFVSKIIKIDRHLKFRLNNTVIITNYFYFYFNFLVMHTNSVFGKQKWEKSENKNLKNLNFSTFYQKIPVPGPGPGRDIPIPVPAGNLFESRSRSRPGFAHPGPGPGRDGISIPVGPCPHQSPWNWRRRSSYISAPSF